MPAGPIQPRANRSIQPTTSSPSKPASQPEKQENDKTEKLGQDRLILQKGPAVAKDAKQAVEIALKGRTVMLPLQGKPTTLSIQVDEQGYEVALGESKFKLSCTAEDLPSALDFVAQFPAPLRGELQEFALAGDRVRFEASHSFDIQKKGSANGTDSFDIVVDQRHLAFNIPTAKKTDWALVQAAYLFSKIPANLADAVNTVEILAGGNPLDEYWAKQYNMTGFTSAASGANGKISFYHGTNYFEEGTFRHEFGHNVGQRFSSENQLTPDGWEEAVQKDGAVASAYAKSSPAEAFAEAWKAYLEIEEGTGEYESIEEMRAKMPRQTAILEEILSGKRKPLPY